MARPTTMLICSCCGATFERELRREVYRLKHKRSGPYCTRSCASKDHNHSNHVRGIESVHSILTENDVRKIRMQFKHGVPVKNIMILTGMSENCIRSILYKKTWKHVKDYVA